MGNIRSPDEKDLNLFDGEDALFATIGCWRFAMILLPVMLVGFLLSCVQDFKGIRRLTSSIERPDKCI